MTPDDIRSSCCDAPLTAVEWFLEIDGVRLPILGRFASNGAILIGRCTVCKRDDIALDPMTGVQSRCVAEVLAPYADDEELFPHALDAFKQAAKHLTLTPDEYARAQRLSKVQVRAAVVHAREPLPNVTSAHRPKLCPDCMRMSIQEVEVCVFCGYHFAGGDDA